MKRKKKKKEDIPSNPRNSGKEKKECYFNRGHLRTVHMVLPLEGGKRGNMFRKRRERRGTLGLIWAREYFEKKKGGGEDSQGGKKKRRGGGLAFLAGTA